MHAFGDVDILCVFQDNIAGVGSAVLPSLDPRVHRTFGGERRVHKHIAKFRSERK